MKIRIIGYVDQVVEVEDNDWDLAKEKGLTEALMFQHLAKAQANVEITYGPVEEFADSGS